MFFSDVRDFLQLADSHLTYHIHSYPAYRSQFLCVNVLHPPWHTMAPGSFPMAVVRPQQGRRGGLVLQRPGAEPRRHELRPWHGRSAKRRAAGGEPTLRRGERGEGVVGECG